VIDLQGLTKSALVSRLARMAPGGKRYALANRTDGSSYEAPTRWLADVAVPVTPHSHAVARSRELCAKALGYAWDPLQPGIVHFGLSALASTAFSAIKSEAHQPSLPPTVAFVHGTSRADKQWPEAHWVALAQLLVHAGYGIALTHGSEDEFARSQRIAAGVEQGIAKSKAEAAGNASNAAASPVANLVQLWPRLSLDALTDRMAHTAGVIGVDSGLSHIAVALNLPHVQLYNFDTAWRTGPTVSMGTSVRQCSVFALPQPSVAQVWQAWQQVCAA
jgi:heptosyltransferase-1